MFIGKIKINYKSGYEMAKKYYEKNGDLLMSREYKTSTSEPLGYWVAKQRQHYRNGTLTAEQIKELEAIGMVWDVNEFQFQEKYKLAKKFFDEHGHLKVSNQLKYGSTEFKIGMIWKL